MTKRLDPNRVRISKQAKICKCCAEKRGASESELFGEGDRYSHVEAFLTGDHEGWTLRQEYYEPQGFSRQRRCQLWDNPSLDKWILLRFKGQKVKEAMTGDGIDTIRVGRDAQEAEARGL
ncbi:hypothetical protein L829_1113 [Mycobacteroides abscessus MAB_030201_1075]|uniref:Uncharacterized protein n=1 Tax=Mycobacteroides abscessus MAB_030201_1075 TaxID=1335410 RepID=A0A829PIH1_9MYCO|nr:hypothetical protein [Mycobacteroides abscessus]ETZ70215.1 hypothetical protein L835_3129 [Mycobacteroides abscessus MAB_110811_1470]ETZ87565.1 hypothetical protein L829_1113 [Mycobacteroides abscessus MAB_030201_1075]ETZ95574.1 hypothetical protein L828_3197 [Mycobacteroides abscessus MAB_030201_1061]